MTKQDTERLKFELKRFVDVVGFTFLNVQWLNNLSDGAKATLREYCFDAPSISKREVAILLYNNQDDKLWNLIMEGC